jgi:carbonic anhydrase/acetyltransferase-like protein (isoleucine patch superfamily)
MPIPLNQRSLVVESSIDRPENFETWLRTQSEGVRRTTAMSVSGRLYQKPWVDENAYVDPTAALMGGMLISRGCYVGPYAVIRLDEKPNLEPLLIDEESNVQDCAVIHSTTQHIGKRVIIAHQAIVHGARVEDEVTIYIQAVVDGGGTVIGRGCFLHQGCYVGKGVKLPQGRYVEPGRKILTQAEADALPTVPEALLHVRAHVLELNAAHVAKHTESARLCIH